MPDAARFEQGRLEGDRQHALRVKIGSERRGDGAREPAGALSCGVDANRNDEALSSARTTGVAVALLGSALLLLPPLLRPEALREHLWAFDALRDIPLTLRLGACALLWLATTAQAQRATARACELAATHGRATLAVCLPTGLVFGWVARQRNFELGDSAHLLNFLTYEVHMKGQLVTYDEPLELFFHSLAYRTLHTTFDASVEHAYALLSVAAGGLAWLAVVRFWHRVEPRPAARGLALLLFAATAANQLFFGYVENYTLVAAASLFYVLVAERTLAGVVPPTAAAFVLGAAASLHILAGWLGLSLLWLWWATPPRRASTLAAMLVAGATPLLVTITGLTLLGVPLASLTQTHLAALKFIFLIEPDSPIYVYPAFSGQHWQDIANQWLLVSLPASLAALAALRTAGRSLPWRDPLLGFLAAASLGLHLFAATWNAEIGAYHDWDLFASMGLIDALLGARMLLLANRDGQAVLAAGLPIAALGLALTGAFIWSNATREVIVPGREQIHAYSHIQKARQLRDAGEVGAAAQELDGALRVAPGDAALLFERARVAWETNDAGTARASFERFLEVEPEGPRADQARAALDRLDAQPRARRPAEAPRPDGR